MKNNKCHFIFFPLILFVNLLHASELSISWSPKELGIINGLRLSQQVENIEINSNTFAKNPNAVLLGEKLFNDAQLSQNGKISCATCHMSAYNFTDELAQAKGVSQTSRRSMPLVGVGNQQWFFWDGRSDSLWSQALGPIENPLEHGFSRTQLAGLIKSKYQQPYERIFGVLPTFQKNVVDRIAYPTAENSKVNKAWLSLSKKNQNEVNQIFVNSGKAIAAFIHTLTFQATLFDDYADTLITKNKPPKSFDRDMQYGLKLFIGKAQCVNCHNGPSFSNGEFHHAGVPDSEQVDYGRASVLSTLKQGEFNCYSKWSDADKNNECLHLDYLNTDTDKVQQAFKTPSLRNVAKRPPYMHAGQFKTIKDVIENYTKQSNSSLLTDEISHSALTQQEIMQLTKFLAALSQASNN